jgi:hypothetical protein
MRRRRVPAIGAKLKDCDGCGWTYELSELRKQKGGYACPACYDPPKPAIVRKVVNRV